MDPKVYAGVMNELWLRGVYVVRTTTSSDTARHLSMMSEVVEEWLRAGGGGGRGTEGRTFAGGGMSVWPYEVYQGMFQHTNKTATIGGTWARMLLQIPGIGKRKAMTIVNEYPTLSSLLKKYEAVGEKEGKGLLADLRCDDNAQRIGPRGSELIYAMLTAKEYEGVV